MARPFLVAGEWRTSDESFPVTDPFTRQPVDEVCVPSSADVEEAIGSAVATFAESRGLPVHVRADALAHISARLRERQDEVAALIVREGGKPLKWARSEAARAVLTFRIAAEEARRFDGELMRFDTDASLGSRLAIVRRFPIGPLLAITPFNFPLNLVAHKVAPALAVGAPIVLKPAPKTPLCSLLLAEIIGETPLPSGMLSVLPLDAEPTQRLVADPRLPLVSFTGSTTVGWKLRELAPRKRFTLELGGNAGAVVHEDADLDHAAARIAFGGYYQAGQSCVAVQRVLAHSAVYEDFVARLVRQVEALVVGDPSDAATDVGPLIEPAALDRVAAWVDEAVAGGATVLCGGRRRDPFYEPTVLAATTPQMKVRCEEIFGPVTTVQSYDDFDEAIAEVNASRYGLQAAVFTRDVERIFRAHRDIEAGGVIVNDVSAFRADQMPYGGTKDSGLGREGPRSAMEEMTEPRVLVVSDVPL